MLKRIATLEQLDWVLKGARSNSEVHQLPRGFYAYIKILLPIGIDRSMPLQEYPAKGNSIATLNARADFWNRYGICLGHPSPEKLEATTNKEIAKLFGVEYNADFSSSLIAQTFGEWPPNLGINCVLSSQFIQILIQLLGQHQQVYFAGTIDNGDYQWDNEMPVDWLEEGVVADLLSIYKRHEIYAQCMFPANHAWFLNHI